MKARKRIADFAKVRRGASPRPIEDPKWFGGNVGWVRISDVTAARKYLRSTTQYLSTLGEQYSVRVDKGDLILSIAGTVGRPVIVDMPACIHDGFVQLYDVKGADIEFLYYSLQHYEGEMRAAGQSGTQTNINTKIVGNFEIFLPERSEQSKIAEVLATVDVAIEQTEALIAKYQRIKTGLMHDLLTRGLDEHGRLRDPATHAFKDSPLGRIPVEWQVEPLALLADINSGLTLGRRVSGPDTIELPYLRVANVQDGYLDLSDVKTIRIYRGELARYRLQVGDVLMNEGGDFDKLGRGTVWQGQISPCLHQNHVFRVRPNHERLLPDYLALVSSSPYGKKFFVLSSKQSTNLASINSTQLKRFPIPRPEMEEQKRIVRCYEAIIIQSGVVAQQLSKLRLVKLGLMQDLLTGRVSVAPLLTHVP